MESLPSILADPDSGLLQYLPRDIQNSVIDHHFEHPELFDMDEDTLLKELQERHSYRPSPTENALRLKFWMEYDFTVAQKLPSMDVKRVCSGICTPSFVANKFLKHPPTAAWLLCRPMEYKIRVKETLDLGLKRMRQILALEPGPKDVKLMAIQTQITKMMDERDQGGIVQRIEQKTASVQMVTTNHQHVHAMVETASLEAMERRLQELREMDNNVQNISRLAAREEKTIEHILAAQEPPAPKPEKVLPPDHDYDQEIA